MSDVDMAAEIVRPRRHRRRRRRKKRFGSFVAVITSLAVLAVVGAGLYYGGSAVLGSMSGLFGDPEDYPGPGSGQVTLTIEPGASLRAMGATLFEAGVVASQEAFIEAADANPDAATIQPGNYLLARRMRAADAVDALVNGEDSRQRVSLPEGYRVSQTIARLAEESGFTSKELQAAVDVAKLPEYANGKPEGFLFPASYDVGGSITPTSLIAEIITRFNQTAQKVGLVDGAAALGVTPREVVTVASIVQREVRRNEDMPRVAEIIYNRLSGTCAANGVPQRRLQMDSTVHFAVNNYSNVFTSSQMRQVDSPYNTYRVSGLPPGPIASPGEAALSAALHPAHDGNCYFVAVNLDTGETAFAVTAEEHGRNEEKLQEFCRESDRC
jgi:UPF0755 protein